MNDRFNIELAVGVFLLAGLMVLVLLALRLGEVDLFDTDRYRLTARFVSSSGLIDGAPVEVAGVRVGVVENIKLDPESYESVVELSLDPAVRLQADAIASIRTAGIIGDKFVQISPGGADEMLAPGDELTETESSINLEELISKYVFESSERD